MKRILFLAMPLLTMLAACTDYLGYGKYSNSTTTDYGKWTLSIDGGTATEYKMDNNYTCSWQPSTPSGTLNLQNTSSSSSISFSLEYNYTGAGTYHMPADTDYYGKQNYASAIVNGSLNSYLSSLYAFTGTRYTKDAGTIVLTTFSTSAAKGTFDFYGTTSSGTTKHFTGTFDLKK